MCEMFHGLPWYMVKWTAHPIKFLVMHGKQRERMRGAHRSEQTIQMCVMQWRYCGGLRQLNEGMETCASNQTLEYMLHGVEENKPDTRFKEPLCDF